MGCGNPRSGAPYTSSSDDGGLEPSPMRMNSVHQSDKPSATNAVTPTEVSSKEDYSAMVQRSRSVHEWDKQSAINSANAIELSFRQEHSDMAQDIRTHSRYSLVLWPVIVTM